MRETETERETEGEREREYEVREGHRIFLKKIEISNLRENVELYR